MSLAERMTVVYKMFTQLIAENPALAADFPTGEFMETLLLPLWDEELVEHTMTLAGATSPPEVLERVVVYLGGSWDGINSVEWEIWSRTGRKTSKAEA